MIFLEFQLKFTKFGEICGFLVILTEHFLQDFQCRPWGCVDIFWNSPIVDYASILLLNVTLTIYTKRSVLLTNIQQS